MLSNNLVYNHKIEKEFPLLIINNAKGLSSLSLIHCHEQLQLIQVLSGTITISTLSNEYTCKYGNVIFINSNVFHNITSTNGQYRSIIFDYSLIQIVNHPSINKHYYDDFIENHFFDILISDNNTCNNSINEICNKGDIYYQTMHLSIIWYQLIQSSSTSKKNTTQYQNNEILSLLDYIQNNYYTDITIDVLCSISHLSSSSIQRLFKKYLKLSPYDYIIQYRLEKSIPLLLETNLPINDISHNVGYTNPSMYIKHFKKYYSTTPLQYRKFHEA